MKSLCSFIQTPDSYEAGIEIAEKLKEITPELVIIFFSIHYMFDDFFEAFYSIIPKDNVVVWGGTGDGIYSPEGVFNNGINAVGINSGGKIRWDVEVNDNINLSSYDRAKFCVENTVKNSVSPIKTGLVLSDFINDGVEITESINSKIDIPFAGGLTGDDWQFKSGFVILNGKTYTNAVSFLGLSGDFSFACNCASGWKPLGNSGIVTESEGNVIKRIDNKTAYDFMESEFGLPPKEAELGVIPLATYDDIDGRYFLRALSKIDMDSGSITTFGSIPVSTRVRVCNATKQDVVDGAEKCLRELDVHNMKPVLGIIISCGGRKWILQDEISREIEFIKTKFAHDFPFTGFASFGEFGSFYLGNEKYSKTYFHNVSFSVLIIGERI
jgi:hypothetical protein